MKRYLLLGIFSAASVFGADDLGALKQRVDSLERDVAALKEDNKNLQESMATREREYARKVYVESVVPMLKPMLKDFGMDESVLVPVEKIQTLADAYRPLLEMMHKLNQVTELK